jgi:phosphonoacetaldehyde hydrolase
MAWIESIGPPAPTTTHRAFHASPHFLRFDLTMLAVVLDWAGTVVDMGSLAPTEAILQAFLAEGIEVTLLEVRTPMGMGKREHVEAITKLPSVQGRISALGAKALMEPAALVDRVYARLEPLLCAAVRRHATLIPGAAETVRALRSRGLLVGSNTGYTRKMMQELLPLAASQGYCPDCLVCADEVPAGRPAPWMLQLAAQRLGVYPMSAIVKVGDTVADVQEARNGGSWAVAVLRTGNEVGLSAEDLGRLSEEHLQPLLGTARAKLLAAGAHAVIDTIADLPDLLPSLEARLRAGERP